MSNFGVIYLFTNTVNGKQYVGQTVSALKDRTKKHFYDARKGCTFLLHKAIRKYGEELFRVEEIDTAISRIDLNKKETLHILLLNTLKPNGYNISPGGGGLSGVHHSAESRNKISQSLRGREFTKEHRQKISETSAGRTLSPESREKISVAQIGKSVSLETRQRLSLAGYRRGDVSEETRKKMSQAGRGKIISPETRKKLSEALRGRVVSLETRQKLSAAIAKTRKERPA